jgi:hypothetical protein
VQEGEIEFQLDDRILVATAGTFIYSPKGQHHRIKNTTSVAAKMLALVMPAGVEKFIAKVGKTVNDQITSAPPLSSEIQGATSAPEPLQASVFARSIRQKKFGLLTK